MAEKSLDRRVVMAELQKLALYYRDRAVDERTLPLLAEMYYEDVRHMSVEQFRQAVSRARSKCRFFPKSVDIIEARAELRSMGGTVATQPPVLAVSDEQARKSKERCMGLLAMLRQGAAVQGAGMGRHGLQGQERSDGNVAFGGSR